MASKIPVVDKASVNKLDSPVRSASLTRAQANDGPVEGNGASDHPDLRHKQTTQWVWPHFGGKKKSQGSDSVSIAPASSDAAETAEVASKGPMNDAASSVFEAPTEEPAERSSVPNHSVADEEEICPDDEHTLPKKTDASKAVSFPEESTRNDPARPELDTRNSENSSNTKPRSFSINPDDLSSPQATGSSEKQRSVSSKPSRTVTFRKNPRVAFEERDSKSNDAERNNASADQPDVEVRVFCAPDDASVASDARTVKRASVASVKTNNTETPYEPAPTEQGEANADESPCVDPSHVPGALGEAKDVAFNVTVNQGLSPDEQRKKSQGLTAPRISVTRATEDGLEPIDEPEIQPSPDQAKQESEEEDMAPAGQWTDEPDNESPGGSRPNEAEEESLLGPKLGTSVAGLGRSKSMDCIGEVPLDFSKHLRRTKSVIGGSSKGKRKMSIKERKRTQLVDELKRKEQDTGSRPRTFDDLYRGVMPNECQEDAQRLDGLIKHLRAKNMDPASTDFFVLKRAAAKRRAGKTFLYKLRLAFWSGRVRDAILGRVGENSTHARLLAARQNNFDWRTVSLENLYRDE